MTMSNITPTTIPAIAPPERPLFVLVAGTAFGVAAFGVAMTPPIGGVLVVVGPSNADVDVLSLEDGLRVTNDTSKFVAILPAELADALSLRGRPPSERAAFRFHWSNTDIVSGADVQSHSVTKRPSRVE